MDNVGIPACKCTDDVTDDQSSVGISHERNVQNKYTFPVPCRTLPRPWPSLVDRCIYSCSAANIPACKCTDDQSATNRWSNPVTDDQSSVNRTSTSHNKVDLTGVCRRACSVAGRILPSKTYRGGFVMIAMPQIYVRFYQIVDGVQYGTDGVQYGT